MTYQGDPGHPRLREQAELYQARLEYEAADPAARQQAAKRYRRKARAAAWRRFGRLLVYTPPHKRNRPPRKKGQIEQGCDDCGRIEKRIDDCTCGCFGLMMFVALLPAPAVARPRRRTTVPARAGLAAIRVYQRGISAHLPARCRYTPSCSEYGAQAVRRYGLAAGSRLVAARIRRCTAEVPRGTPDPVE